MPLSSDRSNESKLPCGSLPNVHFNIIIVSDGGCSKSRLSLRFFQLRFCTNLPCGPSFMLVQSVSSRHPPVFGSKPNLRVMKPLVTQFSLSVLWPVVLVNTCCPFHVSHNSTVVTKQKVKLQFFKASFNFAFLNTKREGKNSGRTYSRPSWHEIRYACLCEFDIDMLVLFRNALTVPYCTGGN